MTVLDVYLESVSGPVGRLSSGPDGDISFVYLMDALPASRSRCHCLCARNLSAIVLTRGFFSNLLFENEMRDQVMQRHGVAERDIVGLLFHLGRDCPGSISCVPEGEAPGKRPGDLAHDYLALPGSPAVPVNLGEISDPAAGRRRARAPHAVLARSPAPAARERRPVAACRRAGQGLLWPGSPMAVWGCPGRAVERHHTYPEVPSCGQ